MPRAPARAATVAPAVNARLHVGSAAAECAAEALISVTNLVTFTTKLRCDRFLALHAEQRRAQGAAAEGDAIAAHAAPAGGVDAALQAAGAAHEETVQAFLQGEFRAAAVVGASQPDASLPWAEARAELLRAHAARGCVLLPQVQLEEGVDKDGKPTGVTLDGVAGVRLTACVDFLLADCQVRH